MLTKKIYPAVRNRKKALIEVNNFNGGANVLFSENRLKKNEAKESLNLMLIEDGVWTKRWGSVQYAGVSWTANIDGFTEYKKTDGTRQLIVIADGQGWLVDPSAQTKTAITGATFTSGYRCAFEQIGGLLYVSNGQDVIARYNGSTFSVYNALSTPGTITLTRTTLTSGSYTVYYRVTAVNEVGQTAPSAEASITVNKDRDSWTGGEKINLAWADVAGALKYIVYYSDTSGYEVKLAEIQVSDYDDTGVDVPNPYIEPPIADQTTGPKVTSFCVSGNRIWATGDPSNIQRVYFTGTGPNLGNFAPAYGGGWIDLEKGSRQTCVGVRDYQGNAHVICKTDNGRGNIWKISLDSVSVADTTFVVPIPTKLIASNGSNSERSILYVENDIVMFNPKGEFVLGNEPGVLGVLRTNELSVKLRPYVRDLAESSLGKVAAIYYDSKVIISVPTSSGDPNRTIVFDRERQVWYKDWTIGCTQWGEFTESAGSTVLLGSIANKLYKFDENIDGDDGVAFTWRYTSPRIPISENWTEFGRIRKTWIRLRNPRGQVNFSFFGTQKGTPYSALGSSTIDEGFSPSGLGWDQLGTVQLGTTSGTPDFVIGDSLIRYMVINKLLRDLQWTVSGSNIQDRAVLIGLIAEGFLTPTSRPLDWKL